MAKSTSKSGGRGLKVTQSQAVTDPQLLVANLVVVAVTNKLNGTSLWCCSTAFLPIQFNAGI